MGSALSFRMEKFTDTGLMEPEPTGGIRWSPQQLDCFEWVKYGTGSAIWIAVAGSGKSTAMLEASSFVGGYVSIVAYNADIAKGMKAKVQSRGAIPGQMITVGTIHSFGMRNWMKCAPQCRMEGPLKDYVSDLRYQNAGYYKIDRIFEMMAERGRPVDKWYRVFVSKLVSMMKQYGIRMVPCDDENELVDWIINRYGMDDSLSNMYGEFIDGGRQHMIETGKELAFIAIEISKEISNVIIDFDDCLYMAMSSACRVFQVNFLFAEEIQDYNPIMRMLLKKMLRPGGRFIGSGDPCQSINQWNGAEADAVHKIQQDFNAIEMPLTVSFRCPQSIVWEAQKYVSHIQAHDSAPLGDVRREPLSDFLKRTDFNENDVVLCRKNAPLVDIAYSLIRRQIPCYVKGREIGSGLIELSSRWSVVNLTALSDRVIEYKRRQVAKLMAQNLENQADGLADKCDTLIALISGMPRGSTTNDLTVRIKSMFQDDEGNRKKCMILSSVHKFKGKEAKRVFALGMNVYMPSPFARQQYQIDQEVNLQYVLVTRSQDVLIYVDVPTKERL